MILHVALSRRSQRSSKVRSVPGQDRRKGGCLTSSQRHEGSGSRYESSRYLLSSSSFVVRRPSSMLSEGLEALASVRRSELLTQPGSVAYTSPNPRIETSTAAFPHTPTVYTRTLGLFPSGNHYIFVLRRIVLLFVLRSSSSSSSALSTAAPPHFAGRLACLQGRFFR